MEFDIISELIADEFDEEDVDEETDFYDDLGADWLDMIEMMFACEEEFDISIGETMMKEIKTVGDLLAMVKRLTEAQ